MATQVQFRGGTTAQNNAFTGASKELTVDTDKDVVVVHDGATAGGHPLMAEDGSNSALALGSAGTPALKFTDTNTGIYSPGADQIALSTGGSTRLYINGSGQAVIGGTSPLDNDKQLTLTSTTTSGGLGILSPNDGRGDIFFGDTADDNVGQIKYNHVNDSLTIRTNASDQVTISSSGSVGINQTVPSGKLEVNGGYVTLRSGASSFPDGISAPIIYGSTGGGSGTFDQTGNLVLQARSDAGSYSICMVTGDTPTERVRVDSSGNMGIGGAATVTALTKTLQITDSTTARMLLESTGGRKYGWYTSVDGQFAVYDYTADSERIRVTSAGKTGIGTTDPDGTLHVHTNSAGTVTASTAADDLVVESNGDCGISILTATGNNNSAIFFGTPNDSVGAAIRWNDSTNQMMIGPDKSGAKLRFNRGDGSEAMTIDSSGRVLAGCSTSSDNISLAIAGNSGGSTADSKLLLVYEGSGPADGNTLSSLSFTDNAHLTASGKYAAEIKAERDGGTWTSGTSMPGRLVFSTTANSASAPTARMTVKSDGTINFADVQTFADDAAAGSGGLSSGDVYKTSAGDLKIKA